MIQVADKHMRLLSVCRVSSNEQSEGYNLDVQAQVNKEWAERKSYHVVDTVQYVETASKQNERRRFQEIVERVRRTASIDGLVFHKVDRACRNLADLAMLERLEQEEGKRVFFSSQEFPQNAAGRLGVGVMGVAARWYTDNLREEVNKGLRGKVKAGEYPHAPPYGYCRGKNAEGRKMPVPAPQKAQILRKIFALMATGQYTVETLRQKLFRDGMWFSAKRPRWTHSYLASTLRHPFYIGKIRWRGQIYPGKHEPLVDQLTWQQVQDVCDGHHHARHLQRREFTYGSGLIRCAHCGYRITAEIHKQRYTYYRCAQLQYREHPEGPAWAPEGLLESQVLLMLNKLVLPQEVCEWATDCLKRSEAKNAAEAEKALNSLRQKASQVQGTLDALLMKAAQADDSLAEGFMRLARQKQEEMSLLQRRMAELEAGKKPDGTKAVKIIELAQRLPRLFVTFPGPQKRQVVAEVLSNLRLDRATLVGDYKLPFSILAENSSRPLNYARQDSNL
ncbi:MAG: recombinase family protein [Phycisphaerae bacterium]